MPRKLEDQLKTTLTVSILDRLGRHIAWHHQWPLVSNITAAISYVFSGFTLISNFIAGFYNIREAVLVTGILNAITLAIQGYSSKAVSESANELESINNIFSIMNIERNNLVAIPSSHSSISRFDVKGRGGDGINKFKTSSSRIITTPRLHRLTSSANIRTPYSSLRRTLCKKITNDKLNPISHFHHDQHCDIKISIQPSSARRQDDNHQLETSYISPRVISSSPEREEYDDNNKSTSDSPPLVVVGLSPVKNFFFKLMFVI